MENVAGPWPLSQRGSTEGKRLPEPWPEMGIHFIQKAKILVVPCIFSFFSKIYQWNGHFCGSLSMANWKGREGPLRPARRSMESHPRGSAGVFRCRGLAPGPKTSSAPPCTAWMFLAQPRPVLDYDPQLAPPVEGAGDSLGGSLRRPVKGNITPQEEQPYGKCKTKQNGHRPNLPADRFNVAARHVLHAHPGDVQHRG